MTCTQVIGDSVIAAHAFSVCMSFHRLNILTKFSFPDSFIRAYSGATALRDLSFEDDELAVYWLDNVVCNGSEVSLLDCMHFGLGVHNCTRFERAGVICPGVCVKSVVYTGFLIGGKMIE